MNELFWLILSKDRPLQLDALLRSIAVMVSPVAPCVVLYKTSDDKYRRAYDEVFDRHGSMPLEVILERDFKADVLNVIRTRTHKRVAFLMDDQVLVAPVSLDKILTIDPDVATYSLRLGERITHCQPMGGRKTGQPPFLQLEGLLEDWRAWHWVEGRGDWRGANSLDGNVLSRAMVLAALEHPLAARIRGPQTLEIALHESGIVTSVGICSVAPQVVNLAVNRVSSESYWYPHGTATVDTLLEAWESGYQLCLSAVRELAAEACHVVCDPPLERRTKIDEFLADSKRWQARAQQAQQRREKLASFGPNALGVLVRTQQGLFVVDPEDGYVGHTLLHEGVYNQAEYVLAKSFLTAGSDVLVVGAHIGAHAIALAGNCRHLVAIEANPHTFTFLQANIALHGCANIEAYNIAAGESPGKIPFLLSRANSGGSKRGPLKKVLAAYVYDDPETIEIEAAPLDTLLGARSFDFVLLDVEGWEYSVLQGMPQILSRTKVLSVEFLPFLLRHVCGITPRELLSVILPHFHWMYIPAGNVVVPKDQITDSLEAMYRADEGHDGLYFLKGRPNVYVSPLKFALPEVWKTRELTPDLRNAGWYSKVANDTIAVEAMLSATAHSGITDVAAYAQTRTAALLSIITDPVPLEELHEIDVNGRHAYRYVVTGTGKTGQAATFVGTVIEGKNDIAVLLAYTSAANYTARKDRISAIADHLVGFD